MNPSALRLALLVSFVLLCPAAFAGVAQVNHQINRDIVTFQAPGATEVNDLRVYFPNGKLAFYDDISAVTAGTSCTQLTAKNVSCSHVADHQTIVDLGPGNDKLTAEAGDTSSSIFYGGGTGNDTLIGAPDGKETLSGNEGNDVIRPGKGSDELWGGSGVDTLDYSERAPRVVVNLAVKLGNGEPGENDKIMDFTIENLVTGAGNDELRGNSQPNKLTGKGGEDKYYGAGGGDTIYAREGVRDWIYCGDGTDTVYADFEDLVSGDCETVSKANPGVQGNGEFGAVDPGPGPLPPPPAPDPSGDDPAPADGQEQPPADQGGDGGTGGSGEVAPPAAVPGDTAAPALTGIRFAPARFRIRRGTALRFSLSEPAALMIRVKRVLPGRRTAKGACVAPTARLVGRGAERCSRTRACGRLALLGAAGPNQTTFPTRIKGRALRPGRYRAVLVAVDGAANASTPATKRFRVLRKKR